MTVLSNEKMSHVCQRPGEMFIGNRTLKEFRDLPYTEADKRQEPMAFDAEGHVVHKGDEPDFTWVYPTFVLRSAVEAGRRVAYGLPA